ncbi:MAG: hypothetical protein MMC23_006080 [Stictis urceolatum]|nr:hypothetical protein [Stictis urceolata]
MSIPLTGPTQPYSGSCHCGALRFTVHSPSLQDPAAQRVMECNCSVCQKYGYLTIYPSREGLEWTQGYPEKIRVYKFANQVVEHLQCKDCGSAMGMDFKGQVFDGDMLGVNVRMIHGIDVPKLEIQRANGRDMFPQFNRDY